MKSLPLLAVFCGFAAGWFLTQPKSPSPSSPPPPSPSTRNSPPPNHQEKAGTQSKLNSLASSLKDELHPVKRQIILDQILAGMTPANADAIRLALSPMYFPDPRFLAFYSRWGKLAGKDVINLFHGRAKERIFFGWSRADPVAARAWVEQFEATSKTKLDPSFHLSLANALAIEDPNEATDYYFAHLNTGRHSGILGNLGKQIKAEGVKAWADWATSLPKGYSRRSQLTKVAREWMASDFESTKTWAESLRGEDAKWAVAAIAGNWKNQAGFEWATTLADPSLQSHAIQGAIESWVRHDQKEAENHLRQLPPSPHLDAALSAYLIRAKLPDFQSGIVWAFDISEADTRDSALATWAHRWWRKEPEMVDQWIDQSDLSDELKHRFHQNKDSAR